MSHKKHKRRSREGIKHGTDTQTHTHSVKGNLFTGHQFDKWIVTKPIMDAIRV